MLECDAHPNIVKLFKIQQAGPSSSVAMERGDCSLTSAVSKVAGGGEPDDDWVAVCKAIIQAVQHLHTQHFVHGNVTPGNVVLFDRTPKLCGFSCARKLDPHIATEMSTLLGTEGYQPIEIVSRKHAAFTEVHRPEAVDVVSENLLIVCVHAFLVTLTPRALNSSAWVARCSSSFPAAPNRFEVRPNGLEARWRSPASPSPNPTWS